MKKILPGYRIIKTVLAVFICLILGKWSDHSLPFYAALSCILMMKESPKLSIQFGVDRAVGTVVGGVIALITLSIINHFSVDPDSWKYLIIISITLLTSLSLAYRYGLSEYAMSMTGILILIILLNAQNTVETALIYALNRVLETIIGIIVAVAVNIYIFPVNTEIKG